MNTKFCLLLFIVGLCGCGSFQKKMQWTNNESRDPQANQPLRLDQKRVEYIDATGISKEEAFRRARDWAAKRFANSKIALQIDSKEEARFIAKTTMPCRAFSNPSTVLDLIINFEAKDQRIRISFEELSLHAQIQNVVGAALYQNCPKDDGELKAIINKCLEPLRSEMMASLKGKQKDW